MASLLKRAVVGVASGASSIFYGRKPPSLDDMVKDHQPVTTNPFSPIQVIDLPWDEFEHQYNEELEERPGLHYSTAQLDFMAHVVGKRAEALEADPKSTKHKSILLPQCVALYQGKYYKCGGQRIHTDQRGINEYGEVCAKFDDQSLSTAFLPFDHPTYFPLIDFAFDKVSKTNKKEARNAIRKAFFIINFDFVGEPFWKHKHNKTQVAAVPATPIASKVAAKHPSSAMRAPVGTPFLLGFDDDDVSEDDSEDGQVPQLPPMPATWGGTYEDWVNHCFSRAARAIRSAKKSEREAKKSESAAKKERSELSGAIVQFSKNDEKRVDNETRMIDLLESQGAVIHGHIAGKSSSNSTAAPKSVSKSKSVSNKTLVSNDPTPRKRAAVASLEAPNPPKRATVASSTSTKKPKRATVATSTSTKKSMPRKAPTPLKCAAATAKSFKAGDGVLVTTGKYEGCIGEVKDSYDPNSTKVKIPVLLFDYPEMDTKFYSGHLEVSED